MWWNKKEVETEETPIDINNEDVELPLYKRMKDLYKKVIVINKTGKLHAIRDEWNIYENWIGFDSNLGKRIIYMCEYSYSGHYVFTYFNINYNDFSVDIRYTKEPVFSLCVESDNVQITQPKYKVNAEQITPEQINDALKEFEEVVNTEYEKYLLNEQYHKMQEEKLANLL